MSPVTDNNLVLAELRDLLRAIEAADIPELAKLRKVERLRIRTIQQDDPGFFAIRAAVSDLDSVPDESRRELYSQDFLKAQDQQCAAYLQAVADDLRKGASALLKSNWIAPPEGRTCFASVAIGTAVADLSPLGRTA